MGLERNFQSYVIKRLKQIFPGCYILKNDSSYMQGIPDILILYNNKWAMLEFKKEKTSRHRPNQDYHVDKLNEMSFAAFIYPENMEEVLNDIQQALQP